MTDASDSRPKVGLFVLAGDSWWEMGVCNAATGRYAGFMPKVEQDVRSIRAGLMLRTSCSTLGMKPA